MGVFLFLEVIHNLQAFLASSYINGVDLWALIAYHAIARLSSVTILL